MVALNAEERERLDRLIHTGKHSAQPLMRARILLKADAQGHSILINPSYGFEMNIRSCIV